MTDEQPDQGFDHLPLPAFRVDAAGLVTQWNHEMARLTGRAASVVVGRRCWAGLGPTKRRTAVDEALVRGQSGLEDDTVQTHDGTDQPVRFRIGVELDDNDESAGAVVVVESTDSETKRQHDARLESAIAGAGTAMMILDENLVVTHCNRAAQRLLERHQQTLRSAFRGVFSRDIVGVCIDRFHDNPRRIRDLLSDARNLPYRTDIQVENLTFELNVSGISDDQGNLVGHCLQWQDVTELRAQTLEADRLTSMLTSVSSYYTIVDNDRNITYANPALVAMLRRYESQLQAVFPSLSVDRLVGANIDVFHENPSHQASLLADEHRLPHTAEIKVGDLEFGITACALFDAGGNRIGSAVEWQDLNARAAYRSEVESVYRAAKEGRLSVRGRLEGLSDAFKPMMAAMNAIIDVVVDPIGMLREHLGRIAAGDLTAYIERDYQGDHGQLKDALNGTLDALNEALGAVRGVSESVAAGSRQVSDSSQALSQGSAQQASSLQQITSTMAKITDQTKQNAENATVANDLSKAARDTAVSGDEMMRNMVTAMGEIDDASQSIRKIIKVIDDIAFQTNLLALNAAVEAARAGIHGKGFAVVAEEVRSLAARSAKAAAETTEMIEDSINKVGQGTEIANQTAKSLTAIVEGVGKVTDLVAEIAAASSEQARGISDIDEGLSQIDKVTQTNTASAEQSAAASQDLSRQAKDLNDRLGQFQLKARDLGKSMASIPPDMLAAIQKMLADRGHALPANLVPVPAQQQDITAVASGSPYRSQQGAPAALVPLDNHELGKY